MSRLFASLRLTVVSLVVLSGAAALYGAGTFAGAEFKFGNEKVPPGGLAQAKLFLTQPKPISSGFADFSLDGFSEFVGIELISPAHDTTGVALVNGSRLTFSILSPSATFGMSSDYPLLTVAARVPATVPAGTTIPLNMDVAALRFTDASGAVYPVLFTAGSVLVTPNVGIDDVIPGSADVPIGGTVTVVGRGFVRGTNVKIKEVLLAGVEYVDASHLRLTTAQAVHMNGVTVMVSNPDGSQAKYFSYLRATRQAASLNPTLQRAVPLFADVDVTSALVGVTGNTTGLAIKNRQHDSVSIDAELLDASGASVAAVTFAVRPSQFLLLEISELFGVSYSPLQTIRVHAATPVQVMGVAVDASGAATPIPAR